MPMSKSKSTHQNLMVAIPQRITAVEQSSFRIPVVICGRCFGHGSCQIMLKKRRGIAHNLFDIRASAAQTWMEREHFLMPSALVRSTACTDQAGPLEADPFELLALSATFGDCESWTMTGSARYCEIFGPLSDCSTFWEPHALHWVCQGTKTFTV